ncbi:MAG: serine hydrolase domain-containing protein [Pseudomonadales bacterium]
MQNFDTAAVVDAGINPQRLASLIERASKEVREGLLPAAQLALARDGKVVVQQSFGAANDDSLFCIFSATKAITAGAVWLLLAEGRLRLDEAVVDIIPEFASNGKDSVRVHHLLTHTAGFPHAPFRPLDWEDPERRLQRYGQWRLQWPPGSRFEYHPSSSMWVLAELIERRSGQAFVEFVRQRVLDPLGLTRFYLGLIPQQAQSQVLPCSYVGEAMTAEEYQAMGMPVPPETEVTEEAITSFNRPEIQAVGVPGGGGISGAAELALYHQALLHGGLHGQQLWDAQTLANARTVHSGDLKDPLFGKLANRGLGLIISGAQDRSYRGFGKTNSPTAFGHNGAGGQLAWVDPASGLSLAWLTNGHDRNSVRQARRGVAISSLAAECCKP